MKFIISSAVLACVASSVSALSVPWGICVVDLSGTPYNTLALRRSPCNNQAPLVWLNNGITLKQIGTKQYQGCGFNYIKVSFKDASSGKLYKGYVGTEYVDCYGGSPVPPPPPPPSNVQSCGSWAVKYGGSPNCCGPYATYTGNGQYCSSSGSNCQSVCCSSYTPPSPPPPPQNTQKCGSWSVKNGGPNNACTEGYKYTAGNYDTCSASGSDCQSLCCSPSSDDSQTCGQWAVTLGGGANACGQGYSYTGQDGDTCGSDCQDECCSPLVYDDSQNNDDDSSADDSQNNADDSSTDESQTNDDESVDDN